MSIQVLFICGIIAGVLSVFAYLPYIVDTLKGRTQPQRSSWTIWSILASVSFFAQLSEGATDSLWFAGVQTSGTIIIALLSIRFGTGCFLNRADSLILIVAAFGLYLWYLTDTAVYALAISIGIGALGGSLTVIKAYRDPDSESILSWAVSFVATLFAIVSVGQLDAVMLAYPLYLFALYACIITAMLFGRALSTYKKEEYQLVQPVEGDVVFRTLVDNDREQKLENGLATVNDDKVAALIASLKQRGVGEHVLRDALHENQLGL